MPVTPLQHLEHPILGQTLVVHQEVDLAALEVHRGVGHQLEAPELDLDRGKVRITGQGVDRALEPALADVAPRAGDIGPDVYPDRRVRHEGARYRPQPLSPRLR